MFCFVDFRNRPQYKYTFYSRENAREYLRKIQNNPLGVTILHTDGRREYFENGLPKEYAGKKHQLKKGCHIKYKIRPLATLDGLVANSHSLRLIDSSTANWKNRTTLPLFMLGNLKFSACLLLVSIIAFSSVFLFQKNLGQSAAAEGMKNNSSGIVLGATDSKIDPSRDNSAVNTDNSDNSLQLADEDVVLSIIGKIDDEKHESFKNEIMQYVKGKPMEAMAPYIAKQPRTVAAFLVGIAMKESKFGEFAPHDASGNDCHNYWGYRGPENTTASGYSCFSTPEAAISTVGNRIAKLVANGANNPSEMVVWKCGATCSWDNPENVRKWIADVGVNFYRINSKETS